jgi:hypothetical protein
MKVFVALIVHVEDTEVIGVYTSYDVALSKIDKELDELQTKNEELGCYPNIIEVNLDDMEKDSYV